MARRVLTGEKLEKELERLSLMREFERQYEDCAFICGIDEAGRGPLAGPVAAGAAILPKDCQILYLNDSKKLSESRREELFLEIKEKAIAWSVGIVGPERIDEINILQATYEARSGAAGPLKRRGDDPGRCDSPGADHQGRREERFYRGSQHPRKGDQGPYDGGVR